MITDYTHSKVINHQWAQVHLNMILTGPDVR